MPRIKNKQDWYDFLARLGDDAFIPYELRSTCYQDIEKLRERPLLVYAAKFEVPPEAASLTQIEYGDIDGFADLVGASVSDSERCDVLIHSPGGSADATERIVNVLRSKFNHITFLIPHSAYSAATMLALAGNEVILHPSACLGPVDPQINGIPARALKRGFENARDAIKEGGPEILPAYIPLIEKVSLHILEICDDALDLSKTLVRNWLLEYMFGGDDSKTDIVENAVDFFADYDLHKTHSRPLMYDKLSGLNLNISKANGDLELLLREAHLLMTGSFEISPFVKTFENAHGLSWGKQYIIPSPSLGNPAS